MLVVLVKVAVVVVAVLVFLLLSVHSVSAATWPEFAVAQRRYRKRSYNGDYLLVA